MRNKYKPIFNDNTDIKDAFESLMIILNVVQGTEEFEIVKPECDKLYNMIEYLMNRLRHSENERFS